MPRERRGPKAELDIDMFAAPHTLPFRRHASYTSKDSDGLAAGMFWRRVSIPRPVDNALIPFRGQLRAVSRLSHVFDAAMSITVTCCVNPDACTLAIFDDKYVPVSNFTLAQLTTTLLVAGDVDVLCVEVDESPNDNAVPDQTLFLVPPSRAAAYEWAVLLARCGVSVGGVAVAFDGAEASGRAGRLHGVQENQSRNALNGARPLMYWVQ